MPVPFATSPVPPKVTRPSTKSVGAAGSGKGSQRSRLGEGGTSSNGAERISAPPAKRGNAGWFAAGRSR